MATKLEELMESIDPSRTIDRVSAAVDDAFNSFRNNNPIKSFEDYQEYMSRFVGHIESVVLNFGSSVPHKKDFWLARYEDLVKKGHGSDAWKWNYEKILTGKDGGPIMVEQCRNAITEQLKNNPELEEKIKNAFSD